MRVLLRPVIIVTLSMLSLPGGLLGQDLDQLRVRANSDDAQTPEEAAFHGVARGAVISVLEANSLGVGGGTFRVKRHPDGVGCFVYEPRTRFSGVERLLVWWVGQDGTPFAVNGASKNLTPSLEFPPAVSVQPAHQVVAFVFRGEPLPPSPVRAAESSSERFTVKEYQAYRLVIDAPMSISEAQAQVQAGRCLGISPEAVAEAVDRVQLVLLRNNWFDRAAQEVKNASDWSGEPPTPVCRQGSVGPPYPRLAVFLKSDCC